jgi:drug/metabolite transporter (DMT)-like permease
MPQNPPESSNILNLVLLIGIVGVSFAAVFIKMSDSDPITIAAWRMLFAVIILIPFTLAMRRKELFSLNLFDVVFLSFVGVVLAIHFTLWNTSLVFTSVAPSTLLVTSHPLFVAIVSHYIFKDRLNKIQAVGIVLAFVGVAVLVVKDLVNFTFTSSHFIGCVLAFFGGIAVGIYYLAGRKMRARLSLLTYVTVVYSVCALSLFVCGLLGGVDLTPTEGREYLIFLALAVIPTIFGHTIHNMLLKHLKAFVISVSLLGEPVGAAILALIIFWPNEIPSIYTIVGGIIILIGIYLTIRGKSKNEVNEQG